MKRARETSVEPESEDWCFVCKEGGEVLLCDFKGCLKVYHSNCIGKEISVLRTLESWICRRHKCFVCNTAPKFYCLSCPKSICGLCLSSVKFFTVKGENGVCKDCMDHALTVEEFPEPDLDLASVFDQDDLYKDYLEVIMSQEGLNYEDLHQARCEQVAGSCDSVKIVDDVKVVEPSVANDKYQQSVELEVEVLTSESGKGGGLDFPGRKVKRESKLSEDLLEIKPDSQIQKSIFASIEVKNMKLIYLKRSLVEKLVARTQSCDEKLLGCFVGLRKEFEKGLRKSSYEALQVTGISRSEDCYKPILLQLSCVPFGVPTSSLSDGDITEDQCLVLQKKVEDGILRKLTVEEFERKARSVHEDITKHLIESELLRLQKLIDFANEKGHRARLEQFLDKRTKLMKPENQQLLLSKLPMVTPEIWKEEQS